MKKLASVLAAIMIAAAMSVTAFADNTTGFVESIQQQPAPTVDSNTNVTINGEEINVDDLDDSGLRLVVTPLSTAEDAPNDEITEMLNAAYEDISQNIEFASDEEQEKFTEAQQDAESRGKTLVASNIFDISIVDDDNAIVDVDGIHVKLAVDNADDLVLVMHKADGTWEVVPFTNNGDGTISLVLSSLSPIAFFVEADLSTTVSTPSDESTTSSTPSDTTSTPAATTSQNGTTNSTKVTSPKTGATDSGNGSIAVVSAIVLAAGAAVCVVKSKKTH